MEDFQPETEIEHSDVHKKWALILGFDPKKDEFVEDLNFDQGEIRVNELLNWVYNESKSKTSDTRSIQVGNWLKDVNDLFPHAVIHTLQYDAIKKYGVSLLLQNDEFLEKVDADVQLAATILSYKGLLPEQASHKVRLIIDRVVANIRHLFESKTIKTLNSVIKAPNFTNKPKHNNIHWPKTIIRNLSSFDLELQSIIPESFVGKTGQDKTIDSIYILADQSGSMANSLVYAAIYASIFHKIPALKTHFVLFDDDIVDLTDQIDDPVDLLMTVHMGSATGIGRALKYAIEQILEPQKTILVLITDLEETVEDEDAVMAMAKLAKEKLGKFITILALTDQGHPKWDKGMQRRFQDEGIHVMAANPAQFPDLLAREIKTNK